MLKKIFSKKNKFFLYSLVDIKLPNIFVSIFLPILIILTGVFFTQFVLLPLILVKIFHTKELLLFSLIFLSFSIIFIIIWAWVKLYEKRKFDSIGFICKHKIKNYLQGFFAGSLMIIIFVIILFVKDCVEFNVNGVLDLSLNSLLYAFLFLLAYIVQGAAEESLFRGWQLQIIGKRYRVWLAIAISSLLFSALHIVNNGSNLFLFLNLIFISFYLVIITLYNGNILHACGWHSAWNWTTGAVFGLNVSGIKVNSNPIFKLNVNGHLYLTGGRFGPEGSIISTLIILFSIFLVFFKISDNKRSKKIL